MLPILPSHRSQTLHAISLAIRATTVVHVWFDICIAVESESKSVEDG